MTIGVIGTGYVGLVTGACFAEKGNKVICVDVDENKINNLINGKIPIYEPGLEEIVKRNFACERLIFTTSLAKYIDEMDVVFSAVGTPSDINGSADLKYVLAVARQIIGIPVDEIKIAALSHDEPAVALDHGVLVADLVERGRLVALARRKGAKRTYEQDHTDHQ